MLAIEYARGVSKSRIIDTTREEWKRLDVAPPETRATWLAELDAILTDVAEGDVLASVLDESGTTVFFRNGERVGQVADPAFGRAFLAIWLHPQARVSDLREDLLGDSRRAPIELAFAGGGR
jgi:hypothetical protein